MTRPSTARRRAESVGIVGGSVAGCAAAIVLERHGCEVEVFEQAPGALEARGAGIVMPAELHDRLVQAALLPTAYATCPYVQRWWIVADGTDDGRRVWESPMGAQTNNWVALWRALRAGVPDDRYRAGTPVREVRQDADGASVDFESGKAISNDVVVGADGYRSVTRRLLCRDSDPVPAPYVLWRGDFDESRISDVSVIRASDESQASYTVLYPGGHVVIYLIPSAEGDVTPGARRVNWGMYTQLPPGFDQASTSVVGAEQITNEAFAYFEEVVARWMPPRLGEVIRTSSRHEVWIQRIYDKPPTRYADGRVLLMGDAACTARPHTASGATKALEDALALERLVATDAPWSEVLRAYEADRIAEGERLVFMGRRLGQAQVESTPPWEEMSPADFEAWTAQMTAGRSHHLFGER